MIKYQRQNNIFSTNTHTHTPPFRAFVHAAAKCLNALLSGSPWQPAEFRSLPTRLCSPSCPSPTPAAPKTDGEKEEREELEGEGPRSARPL